MNRFCVFILLFLFSTCLKSQTNPSIHLKSFFYDVDNFSLTQESMLVLAEFVEEVKTTPIEIIEIIGYVENTGSPVYNYIKSKKRMSSIKGAIDTSIVIHQYNPSNLSYPPAFLYSYSDGYNWRRVDLKYKYKDPIKILPPKDLETEDPFNTKMIAPELALNNETNFNLSDDQKRINQLTQNDYSTNDSITKTSDSDSINKSGAEKNIEIQDSLNFNQNNGSLSDSLAISTIHSNDKNQHLNEIKNQSKSFNTIDSTSYIQVPKKYDLKSKNDSILINSNNDSTRITDISKKQIKKLEIDSTKIGLKNESIAPKASPLAKNDLPEETGEISIVGKTQSQIDRMIIPEKSSTVNSRSTNHPDLGMRLSKIRIQDLDKSVVLLSMNLEFEGDEPIITASSLMEMDDLVNFLLKNRSIDAFIRGHVCCGDEMGLSKKRAKHVYDELIRRGVAADRLRHQGFSNTLLLVNPELTELDRRKNRRVDIIFSKNKTRSNDPEPSTQTNKSDSSNLKNNFVKLEVPTENDSFGIEVELDEYQNGEFNTTGKTQDQIDKMLVREKSSNKTSYKNRNSDMSKKLAKINVENLVNSVVLVVMGLEFEGVNPIITENSTKEINDLVEFLNKNKTINAFIRGHVCCGDDMKLSKRRAKYVYTELVNKGIDPNRLRYQGFSNTLLLVSPEKTEADRAKNRRVDIIFSASPTSTKIHSQPINNEDSK